MTLFTNRRQAGDRLAEGLVAYSRRKKTIILALPSGGVPVAFELSRALKLPLDVIAVRALGVPGKRELTMGAIASGGYREIDYDTVRMLNISQFAIDAVIQEELAVLEDRERAFRGGWPSLDVQDRTVILVDDGIATGSSVSTAVKALRDRGTAFIVVATPTAARDACSQLREQADEVLCISTPEPFISVSRWYEDYPRVGDGEIAQLLARAARNQCADAINERTH